MEAWIFGILCMIPPAVSDLRYRAASLDSCIVMLFVGAGVFILYLPDDIIPAIVITGVLSMISWAGGKWLGAGDGDWWFVAGACAALSTIHIGAPLLAMILACIITVLCHSVMCLRRPELAFPYRLYQHVQREGDMFCLDIQTGKMADKYISGRIVRPALPFVTFLAIAALISGIFFAV